MVDYKKAKLERNLFVRDFFEQYKIKGKRYYICGKGDINVPFANDEKKNITLFIEDNKDNSINLEKHIKKTKKIFELLELKRSSNILKNFQDECVKKGIIINLYKSIK